MSAKWRPSRSALLMAGRVGPQAGAGLAGGSAYPEVPAGPARGWLPPGGGQQRRACLKPCIEYRDQQGDPQNGERNDAHQYRQPAAVNAMVVKHGRCRELRRLHARVMHTGNGDPHGDGGTQPHQRNLRGIMTQTKRQPQGDQGGGEGDRHGNRHPYFIPDDAGRDFQGRHAGVMHGDDTRPHDQCAAGAGVNEADRS